MSDNKTKGDIAKELFKQGFNCSQAVALAFKDEIGLDEELIARLIIGFGGGMGRMREVCGAVSGMTFTLSAIYSGDRADIYPIIQSVAKSFAEQNGSIVCRELLGLSIEGADSPTPEKRTNEYYKKRPCADIVKTAGDIVEQFILSNPIK